MNVIFLDVDGVVNIPLWHIDEQGQYKCRYNFPEDGLVNSFQSAQWVSEFCEKFNYKVVISSTWRKDGLGICKDCLYNGGLRKSIDIIDTTPILDNKHRCDEITEWLSQHPEVTGYLIFDDESDVTIHIDRLVKCDTVVGFTLRKYNTAETLHYAFNNIRKDTLN